MKVEVVSATEHPMHVISRMAGICYGKTNYSERRVERCAENGHFSVFEHASFTLDVSGVSRSLSHQLERHRIGVSPSEQSQRYVMASGPDSVVIPEKVVEKGVLDDFEECVQNCYRTYEKMIEAGVPYEDARYVLPNCCHTVVGITFNLRSFRNFFLLRSDKTAQWEIRDLSNLIFKEVSGISEEWRKAIELSVMKIK